jgi:hypothetical protein
MVYLGRKEKLKKLVVDTSHRLLIGSPHFHKK